MAGDIGIYCRTKSVCENPQCIVILFSMIYTSILCILILYCIALQPLQDSLRQAKTEAET